MKKIDVLNWLLVVLIALTSIEIIMDLVKYFA